MACVGSFLEEDDMGLWDRIKGFVVFFIMAVLALAYPRANGVLLKKAIRKLRREGILKDIL